jgi:hypothetical protein
MKQVAPALVLVLGFANGVSTPVFAQTDVRRPAIGAPARPTRTPLPNAAPVLSGPIHTAVGTIAKISGPNLTVVLRNRRLLRVDAASALAHGSYSAPLFVGKIVVVEGRFARDGTLFATTITRLPRLDETIPDR